MLDYLANGSQVPASSPNGQPLTAGMRLPFLAKGASRPSFLIADDANVVLKAINAFLNLEVKFLTGNPGGAAQSDFTDPNAPANVQSARLVLSDLNAVLEMYNIAGTGTTGTANIELVTFVQEFDNVIECAPVGGGTAVWVAKPWNLQRQSYDFPSVGVITMPDGQHKYTWVQNNDGHTTWSIRVDSTTAPNGSGTVVKRSTIWPPYDAGDIITVATGVTTGLNAPDASGPVTAVELTPSRIWMVQEEVCFNGVAAFELYPTSAYSVSI